MSRTWDVRGAGRPPAALRSRKRRFFDYLTLAMLACGIAENVVIVRGMNVRWLVPVLGLVLALVLPTRLLTKSLKGKIRGLGVRVPLALSLTLLALMAGGLLLNTVLPWLGDSHPLAGLPVLCLVDAFNLAIIAVFPRCLRVNRRKRTPLRRLEKWMIASAVLAVILAVLGAVRLNNQAGGGLAEVALGLATITAVALMVVAGRIRPAVLLFCLYGVGLAVLYMTSLRGWYTTGHDIQQEFRVFSITHAAERWSVSGTGTSYNACLSITILPQVLWDLTRVATPDVFKADFPLIFAACPLALYELSRSIFGQRLAVASALIFISFPTFVNDIVFLNRQEVAFLYVSVILALIFCGGHNLRIRRVSIALCGLGMMLAHYSTSYVFLATMLVAVIGLRLSKRVTGVVASSSRGEHARLGRVAALGRASTVRLTKRAPVFSWTLLALAGLFVAGWSFVGVRAASPAFANSLHQILSAAIGDTNSGGSSQAVGYSVTSSGANSSPSVQIAQYRAELKSLLGPHLVANGYYPNSAVDKFPTPPGPQIRSGATSIGRALSSIGINPFTLNSFLRNFIARALQLLAVLGVLLVFLGWRKSPRVTAEHVYIAIGSLVLLVASVVVPILSVDYGLLRMFQQALFVLAPLIIIGALFLLGFLGTRRAEVAACVLTGVLFFSLTGLMPQITGGYDPQLNLNNAGEYYENYYTEPQEVSAMLWLDTVANRYSLIQSNPFASARFQPYTSIILIPNDFPNAVFRSAYVVLGSDTVQKDISTIGTNTDLVDYKYPIDFLKKYKDLIYASDGAEIFK